MGIALHQQAVALHVDAVAIHGGGLAEQVAGGVVAEGFGQVAAYAYQAVERVVVVFAQAFAAVADARQVAVGVVVVEAGQQALLVLGDLVFGEAALFIILVLAEQLALLTLLFTPGAVLVAGERLAVEVNGAEVAAGVRLACDISSRALP
ncbi:hypothetical protein PMM47T1_28491 [Pseudomonas sp. M47T1]|nr:hypothetical protein PMM47T1_28491 [Pseudomonas sp. M47T1]